MQSNDGHELEDKEAFDELRAVINRSLEGSKDIDVHQVALRKCHEYLLKNSNQVHWFCNDKLYPASVYSLILFSFPKDGVTSSLRPYMATSLTRCGKCLREFNKGKAELRLNFIKTRMVEIEKIDHFINAINTWEIEVLGPIFESAYEQVERNEISDASAIETSFGWCLNNPGILRFNEDIKEKFNVMISFARTTRLEHMPQRLLPGLVYLLFESTGDQKLWAWQWVNELRQRREQVVYDGASLPESVVLEFSIHLYRIQDTAFFSDRMCIKFWDNLNVLLDFMDDAAFVNRLNCPGDIDAMAPLKGIQLFPIMVLFGNCLMADLNEPFPVLLKIMAKFLRRLQHQFWTLNPQIDMPRLVRRMLHNTNYLRHLQRASIEHNNTVNDWTLDDLLMWMLRLLESVETTRKQEVCRRLSSFLFMFSAGNGGGGNGSNGSSLTDLQAQREIYVHNFGFSLVNVVFNYSGSSSKGSEEVDNNALDLLKIRDFRAFIESQSDKLVPMSLSFFPNSMGSTNNAKSLLLKCLRYDVLILVQNTLALLDGKKPLLFDTFPSVWEALSRSKLNGNVSLAKEVISCLNNLKSIVRFHPLKSSDAKDSITRAKTQHNECVDVVLKFVDPILRNISLSSPQNLNDIASEKDCLHAIWSCIFFPQSYQPAMDLLSEVYDGAGRFESIQKGLRRNLAGNISAINSSLRTLTKMAAFEPSPRAVRILMDVVQSLSDPVNPVLLLPSVSDAHTDVVQFWSECVSYLKMLYDQAITWAGRYHMQELVEFTRDTLDLSHFLFESIRMFADSLTPYEGQGCALFLFKEFMDAFDSMLNWLKLGDIALLNSCVDLVFKVFDLAQEQCFSIDDRAIEKFAKFGVKAKRFNNKLTEAQRTRIISKAKEFNPTLVETIVNATSENRKLELASKNAATKNTRSGTTLERKVIEIDSTDSEEIELVEENFPVSLRSGMRGGSLEQGQKRLDLYQDQLTPIPLGSSKKSSSVGKQQTLGRFVRTSSEPPIAPIPAVVKGTNSLDMMRKNLSLARAGAGAGAVKSEKAPAPARPAGFNHRKAAPVIGRSLNAMRRKKVRAGYSEGEEDDDDDNDNDDDDDDDDDDDNDDIDVSDLFVEKKKKPKIIEVDIKGKKIQRNNRMNEKSAFEREKSEKERMNKRLNVNTKPLYLSVLKWNYNSKSQYPTQDTSMYENVRDKFSTVEEYVKTMEPLMMLECWSAIQSAKNTVQENPFQLIVGSRTSIDGFFDVFTSVSKKIIEDRRLNATDLIVLACPNQEALSPNDQRMYLKAETTRTCFGKITQIKSANSEFSDVTIRVFPSGPVIGSLTPQSTILGMKVMQMITVEREFSSLRGLEYYDLAKEIVSAAPNQPVHFSDEELEGMYKIYDVNKSQARAIRGSYENEGFSLIQGPPGTGKTKTILGIVGYSLSQKRRKDDGRIIEVPSNSNNNQDQQTSDTAKILICAPSNAAVDELVLRLKDGVKNSKGDHMDLRVVRLGRSDAINASVKDLTLEELVDKELKAKQEDVVIDPTLRVEHTKKVQERDHIRSRLNTESLNSKEIEKLEQRLNQVNQERRELAKRLDEQRERSDIAYRTREIGRRNIQNRILGNAQVLCATLSGSAHDLISNLAVKFDQVIIDEACQSLELSAMIPLRYGCRKCIMVGDPNQLPPTVLSQAACTFGYDQSLFVRMQKNHPESVYLLNVQYRMHPAISQFPSAEFYQSKLKDGPGMDVKNARPWHSIAPLSPYRFFDITSRHEKNELTRSLFNTEEANVCLQLVQRLIETIPQQKLAGRIGIISPYKEQIRAIKDVFQQRYGKIIFNEIDFNTVDGFQGQEKEIIIMSCVRASPDGNVGFLSDIRRMNVALTRARTTLWILGNKQSLTRNKVWRKLLENAEQRNSITGAYPGFLSRSVNPSATGSIKRPVERSVERPTTDSFVAKKAKIQDFSRDNVPKNHAQVKENGSGSGSSSVQEVALPSSMPRCPVSSSRVGLPSNPAKVGHANSRNDAATTRAITPSIARPETSSNLDSQAKTTSKPENSVKNLKPSSSGTIPKKPLGPSSSGVVRPPRPEAPSVFIPRGPRKR
ncbi:uncharacterized protein LODBEIA_P32850 [Lodderomyces beijingensis]|uniref:Helicase SEN1 n=1 Tax=Lodderomyces beijingensis TaxID=1775926 RepID=A0ABP0ZQ50_9ASCO